MPQQTSSNVMRGEMVIFHHRDIIIPDKRAFKPDQNTEPNN
jgi:hypothetical protein